MLGFVFEKTIGAVKEVYNVAESTVDYVIEDLKSIPDAINKGWDNGLSEPTEESIEQVAQPEEKKEQPKTSNLFS